MYSKITNRDYQKILSYYQIPVRSRLNKTLKEDAEKILAEKLCRCIKKLDVENEARSIGICTKTIFNRKGYQRGKFTCKGKPSVQFSKMRKVNKTRKNKKRTKNKMN